MGSLFSFPCSLAARLSACPSVCPLVEEKEAKEEEEWKRVSTQGLRVGCLIAGEEAAGIGAVMKLFLWTLAVEIGQREREPARDGNQESSVEGWGKDF